jgi:hypothetical protein
VIAHVDHGGIFARAWPDHHARVGGQAPDQIGQKVRREFSEG